MAWNALSNPTPTHPQPPSDEDIRENVMPLTLTLFRLGAVGASPWFVAFSFFRPSPPFHTPAPLFVSYWHALLYCYPPGAGDRF